MAGVLYTDNYLDTLRTTNDFYSTFPSNQTTYNYSLTGTNSTGWTASVSWTTLIVDLVDWYDDGSPNFYNSQVVGYYTGGSTSQYSTGVLSLPEYLYTGPILPTSDRNVPVTIVQVKWTKSGETHHHRFGLIQEWEPGVTILDPIQDPNYIPISETGITSLIVDSQSLTPSQAVYNTGTTATYSLTVVQNPGFISNPNPISNSVSLKFTDQGLIGQTIPDQIITATTFSNGSFSSIVNFNDSLIDYNLVHTATNYSITTSTIVGNNFVANFYITNIHKLQATWLQDSVNNYSAGQSEILFTVAGNIERTISAQYFNMVLTNPETTVDIQEKFIVSLEVDPVIFNNTITVYASTGSTVYSLQEFNYSPTTSTFTATVSINTAGSFLLYANYPGDILTNTTTAYRSTTSNIINQTVLQGNTLPTTSSFATGTFGDQITVYASSAATLTNSVQFFEGSTFLGTATWQRQIISVSTVTTSTNFPDLGYFPVFNYLDFASQGTPFWTSNDTSLSTSTYVFRKRQDDWVNPYDLTGIYPYNYWPMKKTLLRYKDISETTASWLTNNLDDIQTTSTYSVKLGTKGYNIIALVAAWSPFYDPKGADNGIRWPVFDLPRKVLIGQDEYTLVEWLGYDQFNVTVPSTTPRWSPIGPISSTINAYWRHYYRFTPEIPASNTEFNLRRDITNLNQVSLSPNREFAVGQVQNNIFNNQYNWQVFEDTQSNPIWQLVSNGAPDNANILVGMFQTGRDKIIYYDQLNRNLYRFRYTWNPASPTVNYAYLTLGFPTWSPANLLGWELVSTGTNYNPPDQSSSISTWNNFGNQVWSSTDLNSPSANEQARRANDWFSAITADNFPFYNQGKMSVRAHAYTAINTVTTIIYSNTWTAQLTLSTGTVVDPSNLTATWPGTLSLGAFYGNYNPFNITITYP